MAEKEQTIESLNSTAKSEKIDEEANKKNNKNNKVGKIKICFPIMNKSGAKFHRNEDILAHLEGEAKGMYIIGRNGMWHSGIHITDTTTPWCALSGKGASEVIDFPVAFSGEQPLRCMADGEVVAYRICNDYLQIPWQGSRLSFSGSFLLVRHYIQPGKTEKSGLKFYTLYMHLAPYSAYEETEKDRKWIAQCDLAAYAPEWKSMASTNNRKLSDSYRKGTVLKGSIVKWDKNDGSLRTLNYKKREYGLVTFVELSVENQKKGTKTTLESGQQYWMLVDNDNIAPAVSRAAQPSWWRQLLHPTKEVMKFDQVVCPTPFPVRAGDAIGHLGYYQAAQERGYRARYQAHIECFSMDDNLETFLTNPEKVGAENPLYLKYSPGLALYQKDEKTGTFLKDEKVTASSGILVLDQVKTEADSKSKQEYLYLPAEDGYVLKGGAELKLLSQYDLVELGFKTTTEEPASFDHLDGKTTPGGLVRSLFERLLSASKDDTRFSHALAPYTYQRLLNKIEGGVNEYSPPEYLRAIHNPSYRDVVQKTIVKHPSDWYHKKEDSIWQAFLKPLKKQAPDWEEYSEAFIEKMAWMQEVTTEKLGPSLWHMHPVMFLGAVNSNLNEQIIFPLTVKPENDPDRFWKRFNWRDENQSNMAAYGTNRSGGKRKHAGRDLYTKPYETVVAVCDGIVLDSRAFYSRTNQVTIKHQTKDKRTFLIRYGELDPASIKVSVNDEVKQGQIIGKTGKLLEKNGTPTVVRDGKVIFMLHFEYYSGESGLDISSPLTDRARLPYQRRSDLEDPLPILDEGYNNTFLEESSDERLEINSLTTSDEGKEFIKAWEDLQLEAYNDSRDFCTIGYGHLIQRERCENITLPPEFANNFTEDSADLLFERDLVRFEQGVKDSVSVNLYQHEFDALVSLLFNCGENFFRLRRAPLLIDNLNNENYADAAEQFLDITSGGVPGLVNRRNS